LSLELFLLHDAVRSAACTDERNLQIRKLSGGVSSDGEWPCQQRGA